MVLLLLRPPAFRAVLVLLILSACALVAATWHSFGHTWDEPEHIAAGMSLLDHGQYEYDLQHPPLGRLLFALGPYLSGARSHGLRPPDGKPEGLEILYDGGHYDRVLSLARLGALPFLVLLLLVVWYWARRLMPIPGALLAVGLVATLPPILGHAGLATLDVPATATCLFALLAAALWLERGGWRGALLLGLATGIAIATKLSAIPFLGLGFLALALIRASIGPPQSSPGRHERWSGSLLALGVAAVVIVVVYGGRFVYLTDTTHRFSQVLWYLFGDSGLAHDIAYAVFARVPVPEGFALLLNGIEALQTHNQNGHLSFLLGELHARGWWYFYLVALAVKTPLPLLLLGPPGLALQARQGWRTGNRWLLGPATLFVALLAFCCTFSRINIGVRHVLILYPLLALGAAFLVVELWQRSASWRAAARHGLRGLLVVLLAWQASLVVTAFPDYLSWFNALAPRPDTVIVDSDLDWGQDLRRLEHRLAALGVPSVSLVYSGSADLAREPLPQWRLLAPGVPATGWIAVFALARVRGGDGYDWLHHHRPVERIGNTVDLYHIEPPPAGTDR